MTGDAERAMLDDRIREVLSRHGRIASDPATLDEDADLYQAGMSSHATVNVMIALEQELDVEFPEAMLSKGTFASIASIRVALAALAPGGSA